jgi:hypothetical protein
VLVPAGYLIIEDFKGLPERLRAKAGWQRADAPSVEASG